ncbi:MULTISPECIES: c-type cytochrome biogenesis protein CcsB [unclassified Rathayibacter]|uniref:c-type cytochrome biogenesis protein CcsB n=1 Tax=unclassified Rathayibacter TaxID=2609250 RepID=UPI000CE74E59|nr:MULTISPECIES: c-type cytochrome biogenesis protein CcsB [unclassified Rathayibacter]PPF10879.1 c-type cytochrome biogenesis protein CcsB [Rathayibacter sp. AY1A5]PPF32427.1 c-type cytochrome biogenesis protein CcsB [Rathayibacter sp. AY1A3]PPF36257.1 c-type cytochrome biogenesis protein CcsB [Rathayibacter sp. AY1A2]PPG34296.1 c-type cytochrome biogenesis protein CcsB [Rathayibacter sp. AY2B9]PPG51737.1 c-type cytochrome biogenesis protein CcsB [Rathayibacter sp. AY2B3]
MGIYAMAFVFFAIDLARRASLADGESIEVVQEAERVASAAAADRAASGKATVAAAGSGRTATLSRIGSRVEDEVYRAPARSKTMRIGFSLTLLGFVLHLAATVLRGVAAGRVPWANMYEFSMTGTLIIIGVFLAVQLRWDLRFLGAFITGLVLVLLGIATVNYYVAVVPLPPALQSYWLVIHVLVAILGTAFFALGFALSVTQLLQARRESSGDSPRSVLRFLRTLPSSLTLENLAYRVTILGFILWTFTLIAGAVWAEKAWGRYWGWDTKEVWTFIIWTIYAGYIHARATRGWRGTPSAWLAIVGFAAVMFNFGVVNVFFKGLHAYSGLDTGM